MKLDTKDKGEGGGDKGKKGMIDEQMNELELWIEYCLPFAIWLCLSYLPYYLAYPLLPCFMYFTFIILCFFIICYFILCCFICLLRDLYFLYLSFSLLFLYWLSYSSFITFSTLSYLLYLMPYFPFKIMNDLCLKASLLSFFQPC